VRDGQAREEIAKLRRELRKAGVLVYPVMFSSWYCVGAPVDISKRIDDIRSDLCLLADHLGLEFKNVDASRAIVPKSKAKKKAAK
jgi:hypothetical protein